MMKKARIRLKSREIGSIHVESFDLVTIRSAVHFSI